jgi:choline-sulfatase
MSDRPNVLFLMSDEHRADVAGYAGNDVVRTPALDWLAESGVVFTNAYCPSPICVPCRQSMAAGQLPRTTGVQRYGEDLPPFSMTFARRLSQYGYATIACGKLHHMGADQMQGWSQRIGSNTHVDDQHIAGRDEAAFAGQRRHSPYQLRDKDVWEIQAAGVGRGPHTQIEDSHATQGALDTIDFQFNDPCYDRHAPDVPTMLMVSYNRPHYPYLTDEQRFGYYLSRVPLFLETEAFDHPFLSQRQVVPGKDVTAREIQRATAAYYGMIEEIDSDYRRVLDRLEYVGQNLDDWIIIYCSDHGEMLGEHGIWEKQKFFEASVRVPLIVRWPSRFKPAVVEENVNLCDLFATLCELTGVPLPENGQTVNGAGLDSRSVVPLMEGRADAWHQQYHNETISQFFGTNLMIKRDALKYQVYDRPDCADQPEVLFDLDADPSESRNLIGESQYAQAVTSFRQRAVELGFGPDATSDYQNAGYC